MKRKSSKSAQMSPGCMTVFAMPFLAVGVGMTWWSVRIISDHQAMRSWVEVPAEIQSAELKVNDGDDGSTYEAIAVYEYHFGNRHFTGERVGIHSGSDNIGRFQRNAYQGLKQHLEENRQFRCYVNPHKPDEAVLYRNLRWEMLTFYTLFATLFGTAGLAMLMGVLFGRGTPPASTESAVASDDKVIPRDEPESRPEDNSAAVANRIPILTVVTLYWNVASLPLFVKLPEIFSEADTYWVWLTLVFPTVGLLLVWSLVSQVVRALGMSEALP